MNKIFKVLIIALVVIFGFVACGQPADSGITPTAADFDISAPSSKVADGSPKTVSIKPKAGKSAGAITVWYEGTEGTVYEKSTTAPSDAGTYLVTFDVEAADGWNEAKGLIAGKITISPGKTSGNTGTPPIIDRNHVIGTLTGGPLVHEYEIKAANTRYVEDTALIHLINDAMLYYTKSYNTTLTGTAPLSADSNAMPGTLTLDDMTDIYIYDNTLCVVEMTGSQFKEWMEWAHWDYHRTNMKPGDLTIPYGGGIGYNFDQFDGLSYQVDISKDRGQRIVNMKNLDGTNFDLTKTYRVAINNYRQQYLTNTVGVSGSVSTIAANVDSALTVNDETIQNSNGMKGLLADYIERVKGGTITNQFTPSWRFIIPGEDEAWYPAYRAKAVELLNNSTFNFSATTPINVADVKPYMPAGSPALPNEFDSITPTQGPKYGPVSVNFEDAAWDGGAYTARTVKYNGFEWTVSGVVSNLDSGDRKDGERSVRLRGSNTADTGANTNRVELMTYLANGIKKISFDYASYSSHSGGVIILYYQKQGETNWTEVNRVTAPAWNTVNEMQKASFDINQTGKVRFKIEKLYVGSGYISANVDNIDVTCME